MSLLICGLNPSVYSADVGIGFARPGNRFWPAALASGLVSVDRNTRRALLVDHVGMTDLVKRATSNASGLSKEEYRQGALRVERLVEWLEPAAVCFVGLAGWRAAVDPKAVAGLQEKPFGGRPAYVMPSTSGLNANSRLEDLTEHLRQAQKVAAKA
jgi:TDG/mug DNA glycosylase family protein